MAEEKKVNENVEETKEEEVQEEVQEEVKEDSAETIAKLTADVVKWKTEYYKVYADMQNTTKRLQNEHVQLKKYVMQSFMEEMLPVLDNFERSLNVQEPSEEVANFLTGYKMIYEQLISILKKNGLEEIEAVGKEFDPNFHQAVMTTHDENYEENIVVEELQKGYKLKDRVIRATLVKVNQ